MRKAKFGRRSISIIKPFSKKQAFASVAKNNDLFSILGPSANDVINLHRIVKNLEKYKKNYWLFLNGDGLQPSKLNATLKDGKLVDGENALKLKASKLY